MSAIETPQSSEGAPPKRSTGMMALYGLIPLVLLGVMVAFFLLYGTGPIGTAPVPLEKLAFERVVFTPDEIILWVRNSGPEALTVAQIAVNDALWDFAIEPSAELAPLERAKISIPFSHWVEGDPHDFFVLTSTGIKFEHAVEIATLTPTPSGRYFAIFALLGIYAGVIPVYLGLLWLPFVRRLSERWMQFLLSLTVGLLLFLGVDALEEALEVAERIPGVFQGIALITIGVLVSVLALVAVGRTRIGGGSEGRPVALLSLAYMIALGIGLHNLGEGLAIGAAYALGEVALGAFLVIGFTIHNTTEGLAILSPLTRQTVRPIHFLWLGALAGVPTVLGTWIGGFTYSDIWSVVFLAVGAGAIFQVVAQIVRIQVRRLGWGEALAGGPSFLGLIAGVLLMYGTGLFVATGG